MIRFLIMTTLAQIVNIFGFDSDQKEKRKHVCLNGKDPRTMTHKEILKEFSKGKCSPLIIVPGLLSSKLTVEIYCEELKDTHPELFTLCGWTNCIKKSYEFWKSVPKKEYLLWVPDTFGPFNMFSFNGKTNHCWAGFMKLAVDVTKPVNEAVQEPKGFRVQVYGSSDGSRGKTKCGDSVISEMSPNAFQTRSSNLFKNFLQMLKDMGYVAGLTYQVIPYDYRLPLGHNKLSVMFKSNISRLNRLTGKKVIIFAHSLGNNNVYTELLRLDQDYKDRYVKAWVGIGGALLGVNKALRVLLSGEPMMIFINKTVGLHFKPGVEAFNSFFSLYDMFPVNPFELYKDEDWFRAIVNRMKYEKGELPYEESGFTFLPKTTDKCSPENFKDFSTSCRLGLFDHTDHYIIKTKDSAYYFDHVEKLLSEHNYNREQLNLYELSRKNNIIKADNPGVPYVAITMRVAETPYQYHFTDDLWESLHRDVHPDPSMTTGYGDGTVEANSLFMLGLKWGYEYDKSVKNARPVKFVDVCSTYNVKYNVYDRKDFDKPFEILDNEFMGIECDCMEDSNTDACVHEFLVQDTATLHLYSNVLMTNEMTYNEDHERYINTLDDTHLSEMTTLCPQIIPDLLETNDTLRYDMAIEV